MSVKENTVISVFSEELEDTKRGNQNPYIEKGQTHNDQKKKYKRTRNDLQNVHIIASASVTSRSISEVADSPDEIQYDLSFCSISNGLMKPTIASATFSLRQNRPPTYQPWLKLPSQTVLFHGLLAPIFDMRHNY